jgi:phosphoribosylglycinamide formyltransferase-1
MGELVFDPVKSGKRMTIVCFVSGSGTNYREIVTANPDHDYVVFTNRPGCGGTEIARKNNHKVLELSHILYLREARKKYGPGKVPRNAPERIQYETDVCRLIEDDLGKQPDLICLAGFDQLNSDYMVDKYYPRMLNVHPGDTTKGYVGLHTIPFGMAILAGEDSVRSTLFFIDKNMDNGPVLVQSSPLMIAETLSELDAKEPQGLIEGLHRVLAFAGASRINTYEEFKEKADEELQQILGNICSHLQEVLKVKGDWKIFPVAVRLISEGRVKVEGREIFLDDKKLPEYGYRLD